MYDAIVLGCGGMGSAAAFELARRGRRVLALERFTPGHDRGSSHGQTRVIRQAYYEHPAYVPLIQRAFERWYDLEQRVGRHLLTECACLNLGPPDRELIQGVQRSCAEHRLPVEILSADEVRRRFPVFRPEEHWVGVLEQSAGFLAVEECVRSYAEAAAQLGAVIHVQERVTAWEATGQSVTVTTERDQYRAAALVIAAGPWAAQALGPLGATLTIMRQAMCWFATADDARFRRDRFPIYLMDTPGGYFYGLPVIDTMGHKVARHYGAEELAGPGAIDGLDRTPTEADAAPVRDFLRRYLPDAAGEWRHSQVCVYTLTPDRHFIIDRHTDYPQVVLAAGFSGHGFKFAAVVGEILADLVERGRTDWPIDLFRLSRFRAACGLAGQPPAKPQAAPTHAESDRASP